jgi:hypothetical protein
VIPRVASQQEYLSALKGMTLFSSCDKEGSYLFYKNWYSEHIGPKRLANQLLAFLVIILGAILPLIVYLSLSEKTSKIAVASVGALIVIAQGASQYFSFGNSWQGYMVAKMKLEAAHSVWQHEIIKASLDKEASLSLKMMQEATDQFERSVSSIVLEETVGFFSVRKETPDKEKP